LGWDKSKLASGREAGNCQEVQKTARYVSPALGVLTATKTPK
jgi:hypothetical protein